MRKRAFVFLTLLAVGAFLASSPEALRRTRELFISGDSSRPVTNGSLADVAVSRSSAHVPARVSGISPTTNAEEAPSIQPDIADSGARAIDADAPSSQSDVTDDNQNLLKAVAAIPDSGLKQALDTSLDDSGTS